MSARSRGVPGRLVSLCPSVTELVFALGRGDRLVGITRYCTHPPDGVTGVEHVGGTKDPDLERIVELRPDLVLLNREENRREDAEQLAAAGLRLHVGHPRDAEETADMVLDVGRLLDAGPESARLAQRIRKALDAVRTKAAERPGPRPTFAILVWRKPWMAAGPGTYLSALLETAGGRNGIRGAETPYPSLSTADLVAAAPDLVLLPSEPFPFSEAHRAELAAQTGWEPERFRRTDGRLLSWHGPSTPEGLSLAARLIDEAASAG